MGKIRALVIDDSAFNRRTIADMLQSSDEIEVAGTAVNGEDGLKKLLSLKPDVVTCDIEMPIMDGFSFIRMSMANQPVPIVMVSSKSESSNVFKALDLGAVEFIAKPSTTVSTKLFDIKDELIEKVMIASQTKLSKVKDLMEKFKAIDEGWHEPEPIGKASYTSFNFDNEKMIEIVAIGSSTGGPAALKNLFRVLPINLNVAIVISQHMPQGFTASFSQRLNKNSGYIIKEANEGDALEKGKALVAPGGKHISLIKSGDGVLVKLIDGKPTDANVPSVNKMFLSVSEVFKSKALAVVLTGMGADGRDGILDIKKNGGKVIAESEETAVVFGMPQEAIKTGKVDKIAALDKISDAIVEICDQSKK